MGKNGKNIGLPPRYVILSAVPLTITTWYLLEKIEAKDPVKILILLLAIGIQIGYLIVANNFRKKQKHMLWPLYGYLIGSGKTPMRLFVFALIAIVIIAFGFEIAGFNSTFDIPSSFIVRFVEVDLYWALLSFVGSSDNSMEPVGLSKLLTVVASFGGLLFWGLWISVLINKSLEMKDFTNVPTDQVGK